MVMPKSFLYECVAPFFLIIFDLTNVKGRFRASYPYPDEIFTATKQCVFQPTKVSREMIQDNVTERCQRLQVDKIDLLQFHWQFVRPCISGMPLKVLC